ncbi:hypothetical protein EON68_05010, partial [archaeon]
MHADTQTRTRSMRVAPAATAATVLAWAATISCLVVRRVLASPPAPLRPAPPHAAAAPPGTWQLTLNEDFVGSALNASLWNVRVNESHCSPCEPQLYIPSRVSVAGSIMTITTARDHVLGPAGQMYNWSSGWIDTHNK